MRKTTDLRGFTLVELAVVMAIVAILSAVLIPSILGFIKDGKDTKASADAKIITDYIQSKIHLQNSGTSFKKGLKDILDSGSGGNAVITYTGVTDPCHTGTTDKDKFMRDVLNDMGDAKYSSGFVVFIKKADTEEASIEMVYVYYKNPSDASSGSKTKKPNVCFPKDACKSYFSDAEYSNIG